MDEKVLVPLSMGTRFIIAPLPTSLVTCVDKNGKPNIIAISLLSKCYGAPLQKTDAPFGVYHIMVHPHRHSHKMIEETGEFVINIPTVDIVKSCWVCGFRSGRIADKFKEANLTPVPAKFVKPPLIKECPINIECKVVETLKPKHSAYTYFFGKALAIHAVEGVWNDGMVDTKKCPMPLFVGNGALAKSAFIAPGKIILTKADMAEERSAAM